MPVKERLLKIQTIYIRKKNALKALSISITFIMMHDTSKDEFVL